VFENFYLRYSLDTEHVLKNFNIHIQAMEKVILTNINPHSIINIILIALNFDTMNIFFQFR